jgi:hypothetical protein
LVSGGINVEDDTGNENHVLSPEEKTAKAAMLPNATSSGRIV